ncbi:MAG: VCBS repeat-containing protein [Lysobacter sp.]|nr:VCBS repeat-containing protein [Lysobacter sp.]
MVTGELSFAAPDGTQIRLAYARHVEHPDGNWSWIGRAAEGQGESTVITFGETAVFGTIPQGGDKPDLRLTVADGRTWVVSADPRLLREIRNEATHPTRPDFLIPGDLATAVGASAEEMESAGTSAASETITAATTVDGNTIVDVLVGFTDGYSSFRGGDSATITRVHNLVDITNQAFANSQVAVRARLVHSMKVVYPDATSNNTALEEMTGFKAPSTRTTPAPAFSGMRSARDQFGADLVVLLRRFQEPENGSCGVAWLIGGGLSGIDSSDQFFGYSVVSDGQDSGPDGKTFFCREETFAHELGHNMGSQHDSENAKKDDGSVSFGAFRYSFGLKTGTGAGNFITVMASGDSAVVRYRVFSNPNVSICGGFACGVADQADNARSLRATAPAIAGFRATVVPIAPAPGARRLNLFSIARQGATGTESHVMGGVDYQSFVSHLATALHQTGSAYDWRFQVGDYNRDGVVDIFVIAKMGGSLATEIHVLDGADGFQSFLLHASTILHQTGSDNAWVFKLGDYNRDGILDMYAISRQGASGSTEVHVLDGATRYGSFLAHASTALHSTGGDGSWDFALGDYNGDGRIDIFAISKLGGSSTTELHVLNGATSFKGFLLQTGTALHITGSDHVWSFKVGDYDDDRVLDLFAINKSGGSGRTEVHVLNGSTRFSTFSAHIATALHNTNDAWEFELGN